MIKSASIDSLKNQIDLYQLVSDYVSLQRSGAAWKGLSPFSQEKTPSFYVYPDRGFFYCFSTSQGGDAIKFIQLKENYTFVEAVEALADRFNFRLEYESQRDNSNPGKGSRVKRLKLVHESATRFFRKALTADQPVSEQVREYWVTHRSFKIEEAEEFEIGYAPANGETTYNHLRKDGFSDDELVASGLFYQRGERVPASRPLTSRFRGRLMIPIHDLMGQVIAFTGRKLEMTPKDDPSFEAKYVNSPKTDLFHKGNLLFGIHRARKAIKEDKPFVLVEGQLDAIRCWTCGIETALATQGTAITDQQLSKLKNYSSSLVMCLDGDEAGSRAAMKVLPLALAVGLDLKFVTLDEGQDPDTFLVGEGSGPFLEMLESATPAVPFMVEQFFDPGQRDGASLEKAARNCFEIISKSASRIVKSRMIEELAQASGIEQRILSQDFDSFEKRTNRFQKASESSYEAARPSTGKRKAESDLLSLAVGSEEVRREMHQHDHSELVETDSIEGKLLVRIFAELREDPEWPAEQGVDQICEQDEEKNLLYRLLSEQTAKIDSLPLFQMCIKSMQLRFDKKRVGEIDRLLNDPRQTDMDMMRSLMSEKMEIQKRIISHSKQ